MGRGKGKGSAFERDMCRELSIWWNKHDDTFYKTQGSGNRATVRAKAGKRTRGHYGDVAAVDSRGSLLTKVCVVSLKRGYKGSTCQDLLDQSWSYGEPIFATWIREVIRDQQSAGVAGWMIIQRRDRKDSIVFMNDVLFRFLRDARLKIFAPCPQFEIIVPVAGETYNGHQVRLRKKNKEKFDKKFKVENHLIHAFPLSQFLKKFKRKHFKKVLKRIHIHATEFKNSKLSKDKKSKNKAGSLRHHNRRGK